MANKFLTLEEAAAKLGLEPEALTDLQRRQEIIGYRDGGSWKFKIEEVENYAKKLASTSGIHDDSPFGLGGDLGSDLGGPRSSTGSNIGTGEDIVLLSELELGGSGPSPSSTVIGQSVPGKKDSQSDLKLKSSSAASVSDVKLAAQSGIDLSKAASDSRAGKSDVLPVDMERNTSAPSSDLNLGGSDLRLVGSDLELIGGSPDLAGGSSLNLSDSTKDKQEGGSALELGDEDSADVLGGSSGPGSDITHRPSDSGILLIDPADSGLALDQAPLDLTGSSGKRGADFDSTELKADDDFLLTPLEEATDDDTDSGSQVIMLDTEGEFDDATATLLQSQLAAEGGGGMEGLGGGLLEAESPLGGIVPGSLSRTNQPKAEVQHTGVADLPFSALSVVGLALSAVLLMFTGFMMYDIVRNMWSWDTPYPLNSTIMDTILSK